NLGVVADLTAVKVDEARKLHTLAELHIWGDGEMAVHRATARARCASERSAASRSLTTCRPATPSLIGVRFSAIDSMKYASSTFSASACSILGAHMSPER